MLDFDLKIYEMKDVLTIDEYNELSELVTDFKIDLSKINSSLGFLQWSKKIQDAMKNKHPEEFEKMVTTNSLNYEDFKLLAKINDEVGLNVSDKNLFHTDYDYFNFLLTHRDDELMNSRIIKLYDKAFRFILTDLFKKEVIFKDVLFGHFNVYPKDSFIVNHTDGPTANDRYFTILFFLNKGRTYEDGSILKVYKENETIEFVPDFNKIILLDHMKYNYYHEVTKNNSDNVRYSLYTPFSIDDYNNRLQQE